MNLNKAQQEFVNTLNQPVICIAGAGSGKSTTLVEKIRHMVQELHINSSEILAISFTRNSANDLTKKLKEKGIIGVTSNTFHGICKNVCERNGIDMSNQLKLYEIENLFMKIAGEPVKVNDIMNWIYKQKDNEIRYDSYNFIYSESEYNEEELQEFYRAYELLKRQKQAIDFSDMLIFAKNILSKLPKGNEYQFSYVFVDESQDNNNIQHDLVKLFCSTNNIEYIGDFRQSIYAFRGATVNKFLSFPQNYENTKTIFMDTNYRSDEEIVRVSNDFVRPYYQEQALYCDMVADSKNKGQVYKSIFIDSEYEARFIVEKIEELINTGDYTVNDFYILYRNNNQSCDVEMKLKESDIDYIIKSSEGFFEIKQISTIMSILRLGVNYNDDVAYKTILENRIGEVKYLPKTILNKIIFEASSTGASYLDTSVRLDDITPYQDKVLNSLYHLIRDVEDAINLSNPIEDIISYIISKLKLYKEIEEASKSDEEEDMRKSTLQKIKVFAKGKSVQEFIDFAYGNGIKKRNKKNGVNLMTIHASKGLENKVVFLLGVDNDVLPSSKSETELEEVNLMYVGLTRAKNIMYITSTNPSKFYKELNCIDITQQDIIDNITNQEVEEQPKPVKSRLAELLKNNKK